MRFFGKANFGTRNLIGLAAVKNHRAFRGDRRPCLVVEGPGGASRVGMVPPAPPWPGQQLWGFSTTWQGGRVHGEKTIGGPEGRISEKSCTGGVLCAQGGSISGSLGHPRTILVVPVTSEPTTARSATREILKAGDGRRAVYRTRGYYLLTARRIDGITGGPKAIEISAVAR